MFSVGEKVRYLDEVGEATVVRIIDSKTVLLQDEYGLEHSYPVSKLVPADRDHVPSKKTVIEQPKVAKAQPTPAPKKPEVKTEPLPELALAFESTNSSKHELGDLDLLFVNSTKYHLLVNVSAKEGEEWFSLFHGELLPNSDRTIQSLRRQDIGNVSNLQVDVIFFGKAGFEPRTPVSCRLKLKTTRFVRSGNYLNYEGIENPAILIPVENEKPVKPTSNHIPPTKGHKPRSVVKPALPVLEDEVDLHLEAILGTDPPHLSDHEKFLTQIRHFERKLNHALTHRYLQITFIHGVGSGKLKDAIRKELQEYGLPFEDGDFRKYGVGATVVRLH